MVLNDQDPILTSNITSHNYITIFIRIEGYFLTILEWEGMK